MTIVAKRITLRILRDFFKCPLNLGLESFRREPTPLGVPMQGFRVISFGAFRD